MSLLEMRGLQKRFGARLLFDIPSLRVESGKAYVLTGPNGAGKSTLLRILSGLESADAGQALFGGHPVRLEPYPRAMRDAIIYVHQHPVMFSTSVADNIAYGLKARGMPKAERSRLAAEAMAWAGVAHLQNRHPSVLSGGERQRVALARAKVLEPQLLLLDEPTANLDGPAREQVVELIPDLLRAGGSVVMASHDRELMALPGIQRLEIREGRIEPASG